MLRSTAHTNAQDLSRGINIIFAFASEDVGNEASIGASPQMSALAADIPINILDCYVKPYDLRGEKTTRMAHSLLDSYYSLCACRLSSHDRNGSEETT